MAHVSHRKERKKTRFIAAISYEHTHIYIYVILTCLRSKSIYVQYDSQTDWSTWNCRFIRTDQLFELHLVRQSALCHVPLWRRSSKRSFCISHHIGMAMAILLDCVEEGNRLLPSWKINKWTNGYWSWFEFLSIGQMIWPWWWLVNQMRGKWKKLLPFNKKDG